MLQRILTGLVGIPIFLGLLYLGEWPFFALAAGMGLIGFHEFYKMWVAKGIHVALVPGWIVVALLLLFTQTRGLDGGWIGLTLSAGTIGIMAWQLLRFRERSVVDAMVSLAGVLYVGWLWSHIILLRGLGEGTGWDLGLKWVAMALFCTWAADMFAYFTGRAIGRTKLAPEISPNKTIEGLAGGVLSAIVVGWLWSGQVLIHPWQGALLGLVIAVVSVFGDLAESALKRHCGVKDSGRLLPGHGGILDRVDSWLFTVPLVYYMAVLFFA